MKIRILVENKTYEEGILAEHGLSLLIESQGKTILFDAGQTEAFVANAARMEADLGRVDFAVVSHGHYDHTGGFPAFCGLNRTAPIYIHKEAFGDFYGIENDGRPEKEGSGIRWTAAQRQALAPRLILTEGPVRITDSIVISGTIPRPPGAKATESFLRKEPDGSYVPDNMDHEQFLIIEEEDGLYLFSGCSHTGLENAIDYGLALFPGRKLRLVAAGMHLYSAAADVRQAVVERIAGLDVDVVIPLHCTGLSAICDLKNRLGERCVLLNAGQSWG